MKRLPYLAFLIIPVLGFLSISADGLFSFRLPFAAFVVLPVLEMLLPAKPKILELKEAQTLQSQKYFDFLLYSVPLFLYGCLFWLLYSIQTENLNSVTLAGRTLSMGILCGVLGINVAHELGHRHKKHERLMSQILLLPSLYMHFFIEHNRGHHKKVATPEDPASARLNENLYSFWLRCVPGSVISAWKIETESLERKGQKLWSTKNQMLRFLLVETIFVLSVFFLFGGLATLCFVISAIIGFLLLETIDYIEHYGLSRKEIKPGIYEQLQPQHSWNCNRLLGRYLLFELPLHPNHHENSSIHYQALQSNSNAPQMPLGYPGMVVMALCPPFWFRVMNKRL